MTAVRIAGKEPYSTQDGLGLRYVVFFQGCKHGCVGCKRQINPRLVVAVGLFDAYCWMP